MANTEPPITLEEQVIQMKKYVSFRQRKKMREFVNYAGYFRASRYGKFLLSRVGVTGAKSKQDTLFALYRFDVELRRILSFYCNRAEVRFKSALSNACSIKLNSGTFYLDKQSWQCVTATKHGKKECPYCKGIPEALIEEAFVRAYNTLCTYDGDFIEGFLEHVKAGLQNNDTDRELKNINKKIARLKERKSSIVDMRLDEKIDEEIYQMKMQEVNEKMDGLLLQKQSLKDKLQDQQDINKRLTEFQKVISNHEILHKFDRHVFESIIDRVIVGEKAENGEINPYKLKFIFKTGYEKDEVASEQPFSFANSCSDTNNDCGIISLQGDNDTC